MNQHFHSNTVYLYNPTNETTYLLSFYLSTWTSALHSTSTLSSYKSSQQTPQSIWYSDPYCPGKYQVSIYTAILTLYTDSIIICILFSCLSNRPICKWSWISPTMFTNHSFKSSSFLSIVSLYFLVYNTTIVECSVDSVGLNWSAELIDSMCLHISGASFLTYFLLFFSLFGDLEPSWVA